MILHESSYCINGKHFQEKEYLDLIEEVFTRTTPDVEHIELFNGESLSLGGNNAHVSILHHKNDGTIWSPHKELTKEDTITLVEAFEGVK